jgi:DNA-binding NtrC family response regulator
MRVIILDETLEVSERARHVLTPMGVRVAFASSMPELDLALAKSRPDDLLAVNLGGELSSYEVARQIRRSGFEGRTVALVDHLNHPDTAYLVQLPRTECVVRPPSVALLDELLQNAVAAALRPDARSPVDAKSGQAFNGIIGRSKAMQEIFSRIEKVAGGDTNVCIYGESGTGKELIARAIHYASPRRDRPFVALDCTAIPEGLMESQLFGHVKGAFTGAVDNREGLFSLAHTGSLFMDELCELSMPLQAKLLRVVQTREYFKVGGSKPVRTNIRLITATNKDPKHEVDRGTFREDLYYRVAVVIIKVPSLRDRKDDIPLLVEHFIRKFSTAYNRPIRGIEPAAMDRMIGSPWPGNVRQLENFLEQAVVLSESETLSEQDLFAEAPPTVSTPALTSTFELEPGLPLREVERRYILRTLQAAQGNRSEAARRLGISVRCLQYKLKSYALETDIIGRPRGLVETVKPGSSLTAGMSQ